MSEARAQLLSRWQKWRRDPAAFADDLPSSGLSRAMLLGLVGVTGAADLANRRDRRAARSWRREGVHLAGTGSDGGFRFVAKDGHPPSIWPDRVLIEAAGAAMVVVASSSDGARLTAALLAGRRPGLVWLGRQSAACRIYRPDGGPVPDRIEARPVGRLEAVRSLRRHGLGLAEALGAVWPLVERPRWKPDPRAYRRWIARNEPGLSDAGVIAAWLARTPRLPRIGILISLAEPEPSELQAAIRSVRDQIHSDWRLCILVPASPSPEVRLILDAALEDQRVRLLVTNAPGGGGPDWSAALDQLDADVAIVLGQADLLAPHSLGMMAAALAEDPNAAAAYADEDVIDARGRRSSPTFKPDFDRTWLETQDYIGPTVAVRRELIRRAGGPGPDLARRVAEAGQGTVLHLPHVLRHVGAGAIPPAEPQRPAPQLAGSAPSVLAIIPTRDRPELLEACVAGLLAQTDYPALDLCIVDNGSRTERALDLLARLEQTPHVRVLRIDAPFNFSALNNAAAAGAEARLLAFVNDDILVVEPDWLKTMAALATAPDVGAVGAKLLYPNGSLQHGGIGLGLGPPRIAGHELRGTPGETPGPLGRLAVTREASAVTAACMVLERGKFEAVGGFDQDAFPVAFNDVDLCLRLAVRGYRTLWTPWARLVHLESATRGGAKTDGSGRFAAEAARMRERWGPRLEADPCYNPNLTLEDESFALAQWSRARQTWR